MQNEKLAKVFDALQNSNFIPNIVWQKIYNNSENSTTDEDKRAFVDWVDSNSIGVSPQERVNSIMFIDKVRMEFMTCEELKAKMPDWYKSKDKPVKKDLKFTTVIANKFDVEMPSGWLKTTGELIECYWGEHQAMARTILDEVSTKEQIREFRLKNNYRTSGDILIGLFNYVLLDCPSQNGYLCVTYNCNKLSQSQKIYLWDYGIKLNDGKFVNDIN